MAKKVKLGMGSFEKKNLEFFNPWSGPLKNLKNSTNWVNITNIFQVLVVRRGTPPMKKNFSADLHELGHEKIEIKKFRK